MSRLGPKAMMFAFGFVSIAAVAVFLMLYQGSPGPLSSSHGAVLTGSTIFSCKNCHAGEGLAAGCLKCHVEIGGQLDAGTGYHAHLLKGKPVSCGPCHAEHLGAGFPLVSAISWQDTDTNSFTHPHVDFTLAGKHGQLDCEACHVKMLAEPFALPGFPEHPRASTMLGLQQGCISCHDDIHKSGELTRDCLRCHDQNAFKPAPNFNHNTYFVLEGVHAKAACSACHQMAQETLSVNRDAMVFGPVKGKACADCHGTPHRFAMESGCTACHLGADETWLEGRRGIPVPEHIRFGFALDVPHATVECAKCHAPERPYAERYPEPPRQQDQCRACHKDPHGGQFSEHHVSCLDCHYRSHFIPSAVVPAKHSNTYPLKGGHLAVACIQCHRMDEQTGVRQFATTPTACKGCHENPHGAQFDKELQQNGCTACHLADFSTFKIQQYTHQGAGAFFLGKGHAEAACRKCHTATASGERIQYRAAPTDCAACHRDVHRGQFRLGGKTDCVRCHTSTIRWDARGFDHEKDSKFSLKGGHAKLDCSACHRPAPQPDGQAVIQYKPLTTRCEDCHAFDPKQ